MNRGGRTLTDRMSDLLQLPVTSLQGEPTTLGALAAGKAALVVNVASRCGLTPQYGALEELHEEFADRGFTVIGVPCNQFKGQEPGTAEEIAEFCSATYGVTFPMTEKVEVNGPGAHPVFQRLTGTPDASGQAGAAAGVVLAATNERALEVIPMEALRQQAVDVPDDASGLE